MNEAWRRDSLEKSLLKRGKFKEVHVVATDEATLQGVNGNIEVGNKLVEIIVEDMSVSSVGVVGEDSVAT